jgi:hypothetical protein
VLEGRKHAVRGGEAVLEVPATWRLRAEAPGYAPVTLSPFLDDAGLVAFVTGLAAEDLVRWATFERVRELLGQISLTFRLQQVGGARP